ncbi:Clampless1 Clp1 protein [Mycena sanguinolenta]|uniref:Clampless1 Clp1 protein n=1 Tax=Mycena sanguinolenta TaxID=230812 RepID=A0A8H7DBA0_9AGAR|nr:Clampless1 Clp1 protein [Mycena sanguinolenta]
MVLQVRRNENAPPKIFDSHRSVKTVGSRLRSTIHDPTRRRRARTAHATGRAKGRGKPKSSSSAMVQFQVTSVSAPQTTDVEMQDVEAPSLITKTYRLPKELLRPAFQEVSKETLLTVAPELRGDTPDLEYIRDMMEELGPGLLRAVVSVVADPPKDAVPKEIAITINDQADYPPPTHMLALHAPAPKGAPATSARKVTLVPAHAVVLALHCARLPTLTEPARSACPSPASYPLLSTFLYTKRADHLLKSLLPTPPPQKLDDDRTLLPAFAGRLASTYTAQALLLHVTTVHGLWQNACVLGVFVDELFDTIDLAWEVLLTAMAISQGTPHLMLKRPSSPPPPASEVASTSASAPDPDSTASTPTA